MFSWHISGENHLIQCFSMIYIIINDIQTYTTLGQSFYFWSVLSITRHPMHLFQIWLMISKGLDEIYRFRMSKRDLKRSKNQKNMNFCPRRVATRRTTARSKKEKEWCLNDFLYDWLWCVSSKNIVFSDSHH